VLFWGMELRVGGLYVRDLKHEVAVVTSLDIDIA